MFYVSIVYFTKSDCVLYDDIIGSAQIPTTLIDYYGEGKELLHLFNEKKLLASVYRKGVPTVMVKDFRCSRN